MDLTKLSDDELDALDAEASRVIDGGASSARNAATSDNGARSPAPDYSRMSDDELSRLDADLQRVIDSGGEWAPQPNRQTVGEQSQDELLRQAYARQNQVRDDALGDAITEGVKGAARAVKAIGGGIVGLGSGAVRLAGTPVRAFTGWDGLHRVADSIDSGYENWGADALASELPDDDWGRVLGGFGEKIAGTAGSLAALGGGGKIASAAGAALKAAGHAKTAAVAANALPLIFGNDAAVRTYDTAKENGSGTARALGLASVNGAIHFIGFKMFENQSLNKMLGMPQEMTAMMPGWANAAREGGAKTFTELASGVRNGMFKYILAERAKGALKAGGIMGLQNFLSSVPTQMAEGAGVGDVDWGRAVSEGLGGVEEGALMEALMGGAAALKTPKAARKFIADTYFRNGYKLPNGQHVPGLLHSEEGRAFVMKQNPEMQRRILDILDHGGKVTKGELNAACLPPDMTEAELREFAKDWKHDLEVEGWRKGEDEFLGDGEELTGSDDVREQNAATTAAVEEKRIAEEAMNADAPRNEPAPPIDAAREERAEPLSAAEAEAQQRQINDAAERNRAEQAARDAEPRIAALRQTRQESSEMGNRLEHQFDEANAQADAERNGAEQLAREEAYPRITVEQAQAARTEPSPVANGGAGTALQEQIQRRIDAEARSGAGKKVQAEIDGFFDAVKGNRDVLGNKEFNARNADILADVDDAIRRNNPQMARDALNKLKKKVKNFAKKNRLRPATPEPPPEPPDGSEPSGGSKSNLLRRQQPRSSTQSTNSLRPAATRDELNQQPKEKPNETGNVPVEAQPEPAVQDAGRGGQQQASQAADGSVEDEAPRGEVPAAGEVAEVRPADAKPVAPAPAATQEQKPAEQEPVSKSDNGGQKLTGGAKAEATPPKAEATPPATQAEPPAAEQPKTAPASAQSAEGTTMPPQSAEPVQGAETAAGGATGGAAEEPKPTQGNKLRRGKKGKKLEAQEPKADSAPKADAAPAAPATQEATPEATTTPAPSAAEQTQPASQFRDKNGNMKKTLRGAVERIASAIGNRTGKGAITPEEADAIVNGIAESPEEKHNRTRQFFIPLVTDAEWQNSLGVDAESAKNLRDAAVRAKTDSEMAHFFVQVDKAVKKAKAGKLSPKDAVPLNGKISEGLEKAEREGRREAAKRLREALEVIKPVVDAVSQEDVDKFNRSAKGKKLHTQLDGSDRRRGSRGKTVSLDTKDGTVDVGADGMKLVDVVDEISESSHDRRTLKPGESYGKGFTAESDNDTTGTEGTRQGSTGKGGGRDGNRVLRIEEIDGDDVFVSLLDSTGRERSEPQKMTREQWEMLAKAGKSLNDADPSNPQVGDNIMMSRGNAESPASRDAKFAADADYQRWLKSRKANDAEPLRQRYEMEQAKALGDAYQNAVRGVDFEYVGDRDYDPAKDNPNGGRELKDRDTGTVLGIFDRDTGKLKLFRGANWKTLNHEFGGHATMRLAEQEAARGNRALLDKINESIDNAPQWLKDEVKSRYPDADDATLRDEIWAALRERPSEAMQKYVKTLQGRKWYNRAWDAIKTAWRGVLSRMGFNRADLSGIDKMTPDEFNEFLDKAMIGGKTLGRIETASPQSSVRMARGPVTPGPDVRIMDDEVKWLDRQGERFVDSTHNLRKVQGEVGYRDRSDPKSVGVEEVMDPKTGFVDWRKSSDIQKAIVKSNGFVQKNEHILQVRRDRATREMAKMKGLSEDAKRELVDDYLTALHAEERNRTIADRRGDTYNDDYAEGAGRSAKWARDFIANDPNVQKYKAELEKIADIVHEAVMEDLRLRHENGLLSDDEYNFYSKKWKHYVPLRTDVTEGSPEGGAFNTSTATFNRSEYRTAKGRGADNIASSPFAFAFVQAHDGIGKSAKNIIGNVTKNFIDMTETKGLNSTKVEVVAKDGSKSTKTEYRIAEVVPADVVKRGGTKFVATFADGTTAEIGSDMRLASHQDNLVLFKRPEPVIGKDGKPTGETAARLYVAKFTEGKNGKGLAVAKAITGKNMVEVPFWVQPFSKATHFLSRMNTSASPSFLTSNIFNDRNEAWRAMSARFGVLDGAKMAAKVWKYRYADGKDLKNWLENGELRPGSDVADFINGGAAIKGGNIAQGFSGETSSLKDNLARQERKARSWWERFKRIGRFENIREIASSVGDVVQSANELEELGTRYGVYHAVLDELVAKGVPREVAKAEAVTFCRGATTDFNVRGTLAPVIGSFYMFYNANVQGTRRNIQSLTDKHGVQTFATLAGVASAMTVLRYWLGNDEEREKGGERNAKNALEYQKQSAMGIPIPSGRELSILKMRGVDALIPYAATKFTEAALYDDVSAMEALADSLKAAGGEALGVLGGNGVGNKSQISQTLAPSLADPFVQWATGTDWQGERRVKQVIDKTVPQSYNARHGTSDVFKWIAETVNDISGGNQHRKGVVDMAPEDVQLIVETLAGGLGRDITGAINTFSNVKEVAKGGSSERLFGRMPVVKSLVREYPDSTSRYFDALDEYNADKAEFKKTTELGRRAELKKAHPYLTAQKGRVDALIEQVQDLTHRERGEVKVGQKWMPMKTELPETRKEAFRKRRLRLQAEVLRILGK